MKNQVVSKDEWVRKRKDLLAKEKAFDKQRDQLSALRRELPWSLVDENYEFDSTNGPKTLADLFGNSSQLIVYHFMFGPDWEEGCKSCSFWADNFENTVVHLKQRDTNFVAISRSDLEKLQKFKDRMGWSFEWVSSVKNNFNMDFQVSFLPDQNERTYNYQETQTKAEELPGISVFYKDEEGAVYHTYSTYARGLDMLNGTYHFLDIVPKGRDEEKLPYAQAWVKLRDQY